MKDRFPRRDWEERLRPFPAVWDRVQGVGGRPMPPPPPGGPLPFPPPPPPGGPMQGPPPPPRPPLMPGKGCCSKAVRFNPHRRGRA